MAVFLWHGTALGGLDKLPNGAIYMTLLRNARGIKT
jgi:hypothetical protein